MFKYSFISSFILLFSFQPLKAQESEKTASITVSGSGKTQDEAKQSALRSAIQQTYGAFISSKTEILNDQIVVDQMASVSSGNIQSFTILNESQLPDGGWANTIKAIVSVSKLTSFVEAKGIVVDFKGGIFALNIKQQMLNEQGEIEAVFEMISLLHNYMQKAIDFTIESSDPKSIDSDNKNWEIPIRVEAKANENMEFCANYCIKTLNTIGLTPDEVSSYKSLNKEVFPISVNFKGTNKIFYLRKEYNKNALVTFSSQWRYYTRLFKVQTGIDEIYGIEEKFLHKFSDLLDSYNNTDRIDYSIDFLTIGQKAAIISLNDKRTLSQIEKITNYSVKPVGIISSIFNGGLKFSTKNGLSLVVTLANLGKDVNWFEANKTCNELILHGFNDWRLPTKDELEEMNFLDRLGLGGFINAYWSSTGENQQKYAIYPLNNANDLRDRDYEFSVRAVRAFKQTKN